MKLISSRGKKATKRGTAAKTAVTIIFILLIGVAAFVVSLGFYVNSLGTILPNVWADGIKLSGLTLEEARQTLIREGYERNAEEVSATVIFPYDVSFSITGDEAGFSLNAREAATAAFEYGRDGTFFENEISYIRAYLSRTDLRGLSSSRFSNKEFVREVVAEHTRIFNAALVDATHEIGNDSIIVVKGAGIQPADEDEVYDLTVSTLSEAMDERAHLTVEYVPEASEVSEVDLGLLYDIISIEPVSAVYDPEVFGATESSDGRSFDMEAAQAMLDSAEAGTQIVIPLFTVEPEVSKEDIESYLFRDVLSETTTYIQGTSNRLNNIILASEAVDGTMLNPGDLFSFNAIVGERTSDRGYREAGAYVGGRTVQEIGGGICQASSTIYNSVLYADLEVVERRPHGFVVAYLPLGNDATVSWGAIDFKFRNSTEFPIRVESEVSGRNITVKLIGTKLDDTYVEIEYEQISRTPIQVIEREDESVPPGQTIVDTDGYTGYVVDTYKFIYDGDDNLISETLVGRSSYNVQNRVILIPLATPPDEQDGGDPQYETPSGPDDMYPPPPEEEGLYDNDPEGWLPEYPFEYPPEEPYGGPDDEAPADFDRQSPESDF